MEPNKRLDFPAFASSVTGPLVYGRVRPPNGSLVRKSQVGLLLGVVSVCVCCRCCVRRRRHRWRRRTCRCLYCCCCVSFRMLSHGQNDLTNVLASSPVLSHESWSDATRPPPAKTTAPRALCAQDVECRNKTPPIPNRTRHRAKPIVPSSSKILHACAPYFLLLLTYHTIAPHQPGPSHRRTSFALLFILGCPTDTPRTDNSTSQK